MKKIAILILIVTFVTLCLMGGAQEVGAFVYGQSTLATIRVGNSSTVDTIYEMKVTIYGFGQHRAVRDVRVSVPKESTPRKEYDKYINITSAYVSEWRHVSGKGMQLVMVYDKNPLMYSQWLLMNDLNKPWSDTKTISENIE